MSKELDKRAIPKKDRCEGFDELWAQTYAEVIRTWEFVPVTDYSVFDAYEEVNPGVVDKNAH